MHNNNVLLLAVGSAEWNTLTLYPVGVHQHESSSLHTNNLVISFKTINSSSVYIIINGIP